MSIKDGICRESSSSKLRMVREVGVNLFESGTDQFVNKRTVEVVVNSEVGHIVISIKN